MAASLSVVEETAASKALSETCLNFELYPLALVKLITANVTTTTVAIVIAKAVNIEPFSFLKKIFMMHPSFIYIFNSEFLQV